MACPKMTKCPIYLENIFSDELVEQTYKNLYCLKDEAVYRTCKRFIVAELVKKPVPKNILPNSFLSVEDIMLKYFS